MERRAYFQEFWIFAIVIVSILTFVESSHLLNRSRTRGRYLNIQDRVLESCRGHYMCEVFPYYDTFGLNCLNVSRVCDGTRHCRDGSDELPVMCSSLRRNSESLNRTSIRPRQVVRGTDNRVIRIIRTGTTNNSASPSSSDKIDPEAQGNKQTNIGGEAIGQNQIADVVSTTLSDTVTDSPTYPPIQTIQRTNANTNSMAPSTRRRTQRQTGTMLDNMSRFMQTGNPFAGLFPDVQNNGEGPSFFGNDYYTTQGGRRNRRRNSITDDSQFQMPRHSNRNPRRRNRNRQGNRAALSQRFRDRRIARPGSSYIDTPVTTPPPNIPDGFVHTPGNEPHLLAEEQFLEQQFYLTNELPGSEQHRNQINKLSSEQSGQRNDQRGQLTEQELIANQIQRSRSRQERLLREQFYGLNSQIGNNDLNRERYGVSGPFDGGVPSVPGEIKGLNNMDGSVANNAIHNVEALH